LIAAISSTLKTATWALLLLCFAMYMFGIAIAQMTAEYAAEKSNEGTPISEDDALLHYFGSLAIAIFTLFMTVAGGIDWEYAATPLYKIPMALCVYIFFILFSSFCMMNVVTGIFCQNAIETFENDKDKVIECQLADKTRFVDTLTELFSQVDTSCDGKCSKQEFEALCGDDHMRDLFRTLDIETRDALALFAMMDPDGTGELNLEDFIHGCITLRGSAKAVHMEQALMEGRGSMQKLDQVARMLEEVRGVVTSMSSISQFQCADHLRQSGLLPSPIRPPSADFTPVKDVRIPPQTSPNEMVLVEEFTPNDHMHTIK